MLVDNLLAGLRVVDMVVKVKTLHLGAFLLLATKPSTADLDDNASGLVDGLCDLLVTQADIFICSLVSLKTCSIPGSKCTNPTQAAQTSEHNAIAVR